MTDPNQSDAKNLITLAERMGIPVDEAIRQVALLIADFDNPPPDGSGVAVLRGASGPEVRALVV